MYDQKYRRCTINNNNPFWLHYLSLERNLMDISDYIAINNDNRKNYSFKIMQLFFAVCSDIDSIFKHIQNNLGFNKPKKGREFKINHHIEMLNDNFPLIKDTIVNFEYSGQVLQFNPFKPLFIKYIDFKNINFDQLDNVSFLNYIDKDFLNEANWWNQYNNIKHQRLEYFDQANLSNLLESLSALHILNLLYQFTLDMNSNSYQASDYENILIQAEIIHQIPTFTLEGAHFTTYASGGLPFYRCYLNNLKGYLHEQQYLF